MDKKRIVYVLKECLWLLDEFGCTDMRIIAVNLALGNLLGDLEKEDKT